MKNKYNWLFGILLGAIFLFAWLKMINWQEFIGYFKSFDLNYVLIFSFFYVFAYILRSLRWRLIMKPIYSLTILQSFGLFMSGLMINYIIPVRAGELAKSVILKSKYQVRISKSLPTIFIDKISDLFPIILIMILIPLITVHINITLSIIIAVLFVIFLFFIGFLFFAVNHHQKALKILHLFLKITPKGWRPQFEMFFENFVGGMSIMQNRVKDNICVYAITMLAVFSEAIYIYAVFKAFGADISYTQILFGYTLMNLTYILPTPPAQIGSNQFMWVLIFSVALGLNKDLTSAAVTFSHLLTSIWIFALGIISLLALKIPLNDLVSQKELKEEIDA